MHLTLGHEAGITPVALARMACLSLLPGAIYPMIPRLNAAPAMQARAYGAIAQLGNVGSVLGPPIYGAAIAAWGANGMLAPTAALCIGGMIVAWLAGRRFGSAAR